MARRKPKSPSIIPLGTAHLQASIEHFEVEFAAAIERFVAAARQLQIACAPLGAAFIRFYEAAERSGLTRRRVGTWPHKGQFYSDLRKGKE